MARTATIGRYSAEAARNLTRAPDALEYGMEVSLAEARTLLARARRQVERGESPSRAKVEKRTASAQAFTFGGWAEAYFKHKADPKSGAEKLADSTLAMRRSVYDRAIAGELSKLKLGEVTPQRLKHLCDEVTFPPRIKISMNGAGWRESDIDRWIADPAGWRPPMTTTDRSDASRT